MIRPKILFPVPRSVETVTNRRKKRATTTNNPKRIKKEKKEERGTWTEDRLIGRAPASQRVEVKQSQPRAWLGAFSLYPLRWSFPRIMESSDQSDEMAAPTRASSSHGSTSTTEASLSGYTSYSSVNDQIFDPDQNADMAAAGLSECTVPNSQLASLNPGHRQQSAIAQHQPSVGSPKNGDNRLVRCISGKWLYNKNVLRKFLHINPLLMNKISCTHY